MTTASQNRLNAENLAADPRVLEAKRLLMEATAEHRGHITGVRPASADRTVEYNELLDRAAKARGGKLWYPYLGSGIGNGALVELADGSIKYDFIGGIGVHFFGHSTDLLTQASFESALGDTIMQGHLQQNVESVELMELLTSASHLDHCFVTTSGVMAVENALKMAFQKHAPADRILAFSQCFAGRTTAVSQITDKPAYRDGLPTTLNVDYIPFFDPEDPKGSTERAIKSLKIHLKRYPRKHAAMILELVQGEAGFRVGDSNFFRAIIGVLKEHDIAVIADEVQTFGRTGELFAFQTFGLEADVDLVTIGKASQVCATLYRSAYTPRPGLLSQTFTASSSAIRAGTAIIKSMLQDGFLGPNGKVAQMHDYCARNLQAIAEKHPGLLSGPYGIGAMVAFTPLDGSADTVGKVSRALFDNGLICFVAGSDPMRIRFLLPVGCLTLTDIDNAMQIVEKTLLEIRG